MGQRLLSLDFIKLFAMFGVICLHTEMNFYENPLAQFLYMFYTSVLYDKWLFALWQTECGLSLFGS